MIVLRSDVKSFLFLFLFVLPHILISISPVVIVQYLYVLFYCFYTYFVLNYLKYLNSIEFKRPLLFSISFVFFGFFTLLYKNKFSLTLLSLPIVALIGYIFLIKNILSTVLFRYILLLMYVYFYFIYFSKLPDLIFRPGFDEDAIVFDLSSSNAIPMALNITLYAYIILNKFYRCERRKEIILFSLINLLLSLIQQSRIGILVAIIILIISIYEFKKRILFILFLSTCVILFSSNLFEYMEYIEIILGNVSGFDALEGDIRGEAQFAFIQNLDLNNFFWGYPSGYLFASNILTDISYTYNVFLDVWNRYGFLEFVVFMFVFIYRLINYKKYFFPLYYFLPFLFYSFFESIFFPNFWDCIPYLLLFLRKPNKQLSQSIFQPKSI